MSETTELAGDAAPEGQEPAITEGEAPAEAADVSSERDALPQLRSKSPLFEASHASRYLRQELIRQINASNDRNLLCMVAGGEAPLDREDILAFADLLHHVPQDAHIDLMLHTIGGDTDVTEKFAGMLWSRIGKTGTLRVIVPDYAKSAGTLLALAADEIVMSDTSELGPIDPQVVRRTSSGSMTIAVQHHLDAHQQARSALTSNPDDPVAQAEFESFDPATIVAYKAVVDRARALSDKHLSQGMFRRGDGGAYTAITHNLLDTQKWRTHGQVIDHHEADEIGLNVDYRPHIDPEWQAWWRLHCLQRLALVSETSRLFESDPVFLAY
jgi:Serine dehydrogenase proteinase